MGGDIPLLLEHFLKKFNRRFERKISGISTDAFNVLMLHTWPGNVRELENTLEHAFVRCRQGAITVDHLPLEFEKLALQLSPTGEADVEQQEARRIRMALAQTAWNKSRAAALLKEMGQGASTKFIFPMEFTSMMKDFIKNK